MDFIHKKILSRIRKEYKARFIAEGLTNKEAQYRLRDYEVMGDIRDEATTEYEHFMLYQYRQFVLAKKEGTALIFDHETGFTS